MTGRMMLKLVKTQESVIRRTRIGRQTNRRMKCQKIKTRSTNNRFPKEAQARVSDYYVMPELKYPNAATSTGTEGKIRGTTTASSRQQSYKSTATMIVDNWR